MVFRLDRSLHDLHLMSIVVLPVSRESAFDSDTGRSAQREERQKTKAIDGDRFGALFIATKEIAKSHLLRNLASDQTQLEKRITFRRASSTNRTFSRMVSCTARAFFCKRVD